MSVLDLLDYAGVAVFAATGALSASRKQLDIIGYIFLASITGIGGGTLRDVILGATPVFWVKNPLYLVICASVGVILFLSSHRLDSRYRALVWLDAIGLSAYCVMGAAKGLSATGSPVVALVTGMLTATFGGILRDLLAGEPSVLLRPEIYVTAALTGSAVFTLATLAGLPLIAASALGIVCAFIVRGGALKFGWTLPTGKAGPGRNPDDVL
ncbi:putative membrane protein YeiH [Rhizobium sp. PP-F2F-G38]|uniref:Trimeric intracellular cation channel family protein n=1 Tax=Ferranicluibacter rubi TaxID=2715133 RepID=A0AA44CAT3_9HYPH|nr:trimeric intracellular cation channel family protein [Ferranicluibacter rubi]PYE34925.1 putative membrane protein YeiH [Rhizobium sp. PP-WC-1G-195]PYE98731.1 putative membrane protein YeiH [Rhizobium sp. PP-F2F-G38]TCP89557.1 putative membrane protein YeiH [Rhizobium sp. PP-CC-2G-626]TCQ11576.1 putative membrane protein YeiH [Rhizobium sp. PP-F2F-G36]TCQ29651.1 putative membrane protein YeiH [Rhizobium sp. PP-CC-3G-465]